MKGTTAKIETWQEAKEEFDRAERAQEERDRSNGLIYSLDDETVRDYLENQCVDCHQNPCRVLVKKEAFHTLSDALDSLTTAQRRRITRFVLERKHYSEIARLEGVDESAVRRSIERGLLQMRKKLIGTSISGNDFSEPSQTRYVKHYHPKKETTDRQNESDPLINLNGVPEKPSALWGEEAQWNERGMTLKSRSDGYEACVDEGGVQDGE